MSSLEKKRVTLLQLAKTFLFIGATSFGGGITAYIRRIVVDNKEWLTNDEFFPGLALAQLMPGANVVGISLYVGNHLRGILGAIIAVCCIIIPPAFLFFGLGFIYFSMGNVPSVESMLKGAGAVACGLMASMFIESAQASLKAMADVIFFLATFALVYFAHLHVPYAILIMAPIAIWWYRPAAVAEQQEVKFGVEIEKEKLQQESTPHE